MKKSIVTMFAGVVMLAAPVQAQTVPVAAPDAAMVDASPEDLDAVRGGYWVVVAAAGGAAIRYCSKNKVSCAKGAYKVYSTYTAAVEFARSRGWIK